MLVRAKWGKDTRTKGETESRRGTLTADARTRTRARARVQTQTRSFYFPAGRPLFADVASFSRLTIGLVSFSPPALPALDERLSQL